MRPCHVVLLTPPKSTHPSRLLSRLGRALVSPLAGTLMDLPASVANKRLTGELTSLDATLTQKVGGLSLTRIPNNVCLLSKHRDDRPVPTTFSSPIITSLLRYLITSHVQLPHQIRNNHLPENHRIGPHFHLPSQVPALRIDPRLLRHISSAQKQIRIRNRHLCIQSARDDQHRRHRFPEQ